MTEFMQGTVDAPVVGKTKKVYIYVPLGLAGAYVAWRWWQASQASSEEDTAASDGTYSSDDLSEYGLSTTGGTGTVTGNNGVIDSDGTTSDVDTNSEWNNKAVELLSNSGYDPAVVRAALGEFLDRRALDKAEASIARTAIGAAGQPPENRPWSVIEEAGAGTGTLAAPTNVRAWNKATASVISMQWDAVAGARNYVVYRTDLGMSEPIGYSSDTKFNANGLSGAKTYSFIVCAVGTTGKVGGKSSVYTAKTAAVNLTKPTGLKSSSVGRTSFRVTCNKVNGATYYRWLVNGKGVSPSDANYKDFTGMKPGTTYRISVAADTSNQTPGPTSGSLSVKTKK